MNYLLDVFDLKIYDEDGTLLTEVKDSTQGYLAYNDEYKSYLSLSQASLDLGILKLIGESDDAKSDFDKDKGSNETTIKFSKTKPVKYLKLIAFATIGDGKGSRNEEGLKIVIGKSKIINGLNLEFDMGTLFKPTHTFEILTDDDGNDLELTFVK